MLKVELVEKFAKNLYTFSLIDNEFTIKKVLKKGLKGEVSSFLRVEIFTPDNYTTNHQ